MTIYPESTHPYVDQIGGFVEDILTKATEKDFAGIVGHSFNGGRGYSPSYEFCKRHKDEDYDVFLLVHVRKDAQCERV